MKDIKSQSLNAVEKQIVSVWRSIYRSLASVKLAIALLIIILVCCLTGVTIVRGDRAGALIFGTIWFNGLLVLLVVNVAFCFFGRILGKKVTLVSLGLILFHLSFVAMLGGIVYNSMFYFRGLIRLTEGEALPSGDPQSYDWTLHGRFFSYTKLKGETTLIKMHKGYKVDGAEKLVAYEVAVGEGGTKKQGIIYITHRLDHNGFSYYRDREGYSVLTVLYDKAGRERYGAYVPLQSIKQKDGTYLYSTGLKEEPGAFPFPQNPEKPLFALQLAYIPSLTKEKEKAGEASFQVWPLREGEVEPGEKPVAEGKAELDKKFDAGDHFLSVKDVRYWAAMTVQYEPGKPIVLASLWVGLFGLVITFYGRIKKPRQST